MQFLLNLVEAVDFEATRRHLRRDALLRDAGILPDRFADLVSRRSEPSEEEVRGLTRVLGLPASHLFRSGARAGQQRSAAIMESAASRI